MRGILVWSRPWIDQQQTLVVVAVDAAIVITAVAIDADFSIAIIVSLVGSHTRRTAQASQGLHDRLRRGQIFGRRQRPGSMLGTSGLPTVLSARCERG